MAQITTYGSGRVTEADKRAAAERAKENARISEAERRESLLAAGKGQLDKIATDLVLEAEQNVAPPDPKAIAAEKRKLAAAKRKDEARLAELVKQWNANRDAQYEGLEMMFDAIFADMPLSVEAAALARKLGANNPIGRGTMMWINDGLSGVPQNRMYLVERICGKIVDRYRGSGAFDRSYFELPL